MRSVCSRAKRVRIARSDHFAECMGGQPPSAASTRSTNPPSARSRPRVAVIDDDRRDRVDAVAVGVHCELRRLDPLARIRGDASASLYASSRPAGNVSGRRDIDVDRDVAVERREPLARRLAQRRLCGRPRGCRARGSSARSREASPGTGAPGDHSAGHGPGSSCSTTSRRRGRTASRRPRAPRGSARRVDLAAARGEEGDRRAVGPSSRLTAASCSSNASSDPTPRAPVRRARSRPRGVDLRAEVLEGVAGSISGEPVSRSIVSFGVSFRPRSRGCRGASRTAAAGCPRRAGRRGLAAPAARRPDLQRDHVAERIRREVADAAARPVDVLQDAVGVVGHVDAEEVLHPRLPDLGQVVERDRALEQLLLELEAEDDVEAVVARRRRRGSGPAPPGRSHGRTCRARRPRVAGTSPGARGTSAPRTAGSGRRGSPTSGTATR